jgi:hypothetical protein
LTLPLQGAGSSPVHADRQCAGERPFGNTWIQIALGKPRSRYREPDEDIRVEGPILLIVQDLRTRARWGEAHGKCEQTSRWSRHSGQEFG